ncbi:MAG: hypothetical protein WA139_02755 [Candidatus Aenigmatarchaeota archaeon]
MLQTEIPDSAKPHVYFDVSSLFRPKDVVDVNIKAEVNAMIEICRFIEEDRLFLVDSFGIHDTIKAKTKELEKIPNIKLKEKIKYALEILKKKQHLAPAPRLENPETDGFAYFCFGNEEKTKQLHKDCDELERLLNEEDYKIVKFVIASAAINYFITSDNHFFKPEIVKILHNYSKNIYKPDEFLKYFLKCLKPCQDRRISN